MKKNYILFLFTALFIHTINAQITLTQNTDNVITASNSVACPSGDNQQARLFDLASYGVTSDFELTSGEIGVQSVSATFDVTVNIYDSNASFPTGYPGTLLGSQVVTIPLGSDETIVSYSFSPPITIPATSTHVLVEVAQSDTTSWFIGGTADETADCYLKSAACSITDYTTPGLISFPDAHFYITVSGNLLSVEEYSLDSVSIFPNPVKDVVNIEMHKSIKVKNAKIYSITGQVVLQVENARKLDVSNLNPGIYLLKVETDKGDITRKIIKS
ncbi:T9SS type A sorting domain-containing protein [Xanthomarina sp. F2636L]|uniref:T9SS type A sorting domain-containing protein n=1 Tax=Xanthomarina sp. F2636L TaxID=2996018 RepID=UPI00225E0589|nr:T9SS type A sorting domain-containing protein [Xanthomarina sp. F2636L]MCX7550176.1 T9SS type A sorting domain-containing protein [Xanthomarina sp. F2636L]